MNDDIIQCWSEEIWKTGQSVWKLEESEKSGLKLSIQRKNKDYGIWYHHFMANRWGYNGNSDRLYFLGSRITADGDCSSEIKRRLLFGRKTIALTRQTFIGKVTSLFFNMLSRLVIAFLPRSNCLLI